MMNLRQARGIFRLESRVSLEDLNNIFRKLVKKYHPDKVRDHPDWAHERMSEINAAYELLVERMTQPVPDRGVPEADIDNIQNQEEDYFDDISVQDDFPPIDKGSTGEFYNAFHGFLDGLGLYFQYGLNNPSIRSDGIRRFRYREAMRNIENGNNALIACSKKYNHIAIATASRFAKLTVADISLGELPLTASGQLRLYEQQFRNARQNFDMAIKDVLFPELLPGHLRGVARSRMYACYSDFVTFLTIFENDDKQKTGILQAARYDAFIRLLHLRNLGVLEF